VLLGGSEQRGEVGGVEGAGAQDEHDYRVQQHRGGAAVHDREQGLALLESQGA